MRVRLVPLVFLAWAFGLPGAAPALDFRATAEAATVLYDAPSLKAKPVFVIGRDYPLEIVVSVEGWAKVRDATGALAWIEKKALTERRTVIVKTPQVEVFVAPDASSSVVFRAEQNVLLEIQELPSPGSSWLRVRHRDGQSGFARMQQLWGF
jgi:SH3-like domain-containing protein